MNLKAYLAETGVTSREFAYKLDISERYLSGIITGAHLPSRRLARDIEAATNGKVKIEFSTKTKKVREDEKRIKKIKEKQRKIEKEKSMQLDMFEKLIPKEKRELFLGMDLVQIQEIANACKKRF